MTPPVRTLLIDNYDSYTYNLYQLISDVNEVVPIVVANDHVTAEQVRRLPALHIVCNGDHAMKLQT